MRNKQSQLLEHLKSLLILLLSLSSVYLLTRTSLTGPSGNDWIQTFLTNLLPAAVEPTASLSERQVGVIRPVRLVVSGSAPGRYGVQYDQETVDARFNGVLLNLFSDALSGAGDSRNVSETIFQTALSSQSQPVVYLDLLGAVPGQILSAWLGGRTGMIPLSGSVRRLFLTTDRGGTPLLYYINEEDSSYYACDTAPDLPTRLADAIEAFSPNGTVFAFEDADQYSKLAPYTLILPETPHPTVYLTSNPIPDGSAEQTQLIQALSFHPQSNAINLDDLGLREGTDTLRISPTGVVNYYSAAVEDPRYPVVGQSRQAMADAAWLLLEATVTKLAGDGRVYLTTIKEEAEGTVFYFDYQLNGAMVQLGADGYAARILIQEGRIASFTLQLRRYQATDTKSILLPEPQALAAIAALGLDGSELSLCYRDLRGDQVSAGWVAH